MSVTFTPFRAAPVWSVTAPEMVPLPCCACPVGTKQVSASDNSDNKVFDRNMVQALAGYTEPRGSASDPSALLPKAVRFSLAQETSDVKSKISDGSGAGTCQTSALERDRLFLTQPARP